MIRLALAGLAALLALAPARAQEPSRLDRIIERGVLRVGSTGDYKPFSSLDKTDNTFSGFDIDLAQDLGRALGVKVEIVPTTWSTLMKDLEGERFDVGMSGISVTLERQKKAFFSAPYMRGGKAPITRCENVARFQSLPEIDRPGVKAIVNPGGTNERFARANLKNAEIAVFPDNTRIFDEVAAGRADLMMTDSVETRVQQKLRPGVLCAVNPDKPLDFSEFGYLLPRDVALKQFVDTWLHVANENGTTKGLLAKWVD